MAYIKNNWVDREGITRYFRTIEDDGAEIFTPDYSKVTELGTPVNADNMNHIEEGIEGCAIRKYNTDETFIEGEWAVGIVDSKQGIYISLIDDNIGNPLNDENCWKLWVPESDSDKFVKKIGDTMTGNLVIQRENNPNFCTKDTEAAYNEAPAESRECGIYRAVDKNGEWMGIFGVDRMANNQTRIKMQGKSHTGASARIQLVSDPSTGEWRAEAPNPHGNSNTNDIATTIWVRNYANGSWIKKTSKLFSGNIANGSPKTLSLSSYLPKDSNKYEVIWKAWGHGGNVAASTTYIDYESIMTMPGGSTTTWATNGLLVVGANRQIVLSNGDGTKDMEFTALAYRRVN